MASRSKEQTDYILISMTDGKGCDTWADGINALRVFVVRNWPHKDIVEVRSTTRSGTYATTGYIAFNPAKRIYYWLPKRKSMLDDARTFNPATGRLEDPIPRNVASDIFSACWHSVVVRRDGGKPSKVAIDRVLDGKPFWRHRSWPRCACPRRITTSSTSTHHRRDSTAYPRGHPPWISHLPAGTGPSTSAARPPSPRPRRTWTRSGTSATPCREAPRSTSSRARGTWDAPSTTSTAPRGRPTSGCGTPPTAPATPPLSILTDP